MADHMDLPWTWHAKSADQAHNGSIYHLKRPGHAYAIAMQPQYVDDEQFAANAAFIVRAVNAHDDLVKALEEARSQLEAYELAATGELYNSLKITAALTKAKP